MSWMSWEQIIDGGFHNFLNIGNGVVDFSLIYHIEFEHRDGERVIVTSNDELEVFRSSYYELDLEGWGTECSIQINSVAIKQQVDRMVSQILEPEMNNKLA